MTVQPGFNNSRSMVLDIEDGEAEGDTSEYTIFEILSINKSKIIMHVNNIISQFIQNIKNEYAQEWFEKKQNQYTLRKNSMKKIEYKNYNLKKSICNNSIENTLLKSEERPL